MAVALQLPIDPPTARFQVEQLTAESDGQGGEVVMVTGHTSCTACGYEMAVVIEVGDLGFGHCPRPGCGAPHFFEPVNLELSAHEGGR